MILSNIKQTIEVSFKSKNTKKASTLYTSLVFGIVIGIGVSVLNTRLLGPKQYGDLKFLQTLFSFVVTSLTFGLFNSGSRLIALNKYAKIKNELIGILILAAAFMAIVMIIGIVIISFVEGQIFNNNLGKIIRILSPLLFVFPLKLCLENIMQGDNRIYELSILQLTPQTFYLVAAVLFNYLIPLSLVSALFIQFVTLAILLFLFIFILKPKLKNIKRNIEILLHENKKYGFPVFTGIIANVLTAHLGSFAIAYFIDNINVGFFSLALTITMPLAMIPSVMGTTFFKDFTNSNSIPKKETKVTIILSIGSLLFFILIIKRIVLILYSSDYMSVVTLSYIIAIGCIFHGFGDYINRFLGAHGKGIVLRNSAIVVSFANILGYVGLVYKFGINGAAVTKLLSSIVYFSMMYLNYLKLRKEINYV